MEIEIEKVSMQAPVEQLSRSGLRGRQRRIWGDILTRSQNHGMLGQPGTMTIIPRQLWLRILFMIFVIRRVGGIWQARWTMLLRLHHDRSLQSRAQRNPDFILPPPPPLVYVGNNSGVVCGYKNSLIPAKVSISGLKGPPSIQGN